MRYLCPLKDERGEGCHEAAARRLIRYPEGTISEVEMMRGRGSPARRGVAVVLVLVAACSFCLVQSTRMDIGGDEMPIRAAIEVSANHGAISIDGDAELAAFPNKTGAGLAGNPYIIQDLVIAAPVGGSYIIIGNTTALLTIQNCTLIGEGYDGIVLSRCVNVNISSNRISGCGKGINLFATNYSFIVGNNLSDNSYAIEFSSSHHNGITNNSVIGYGVEGIGLDSSKYNTLEGNNVTNYENPTYYAWGISLYGCDENTITRNDVAFNGETGILLASSYANNVSMNTVSTNTNGIRTWRCARNVIRNNTLEGNQEGIYISMGSWILITGNVAVNNRNGINLHASNYSTLSENNITGSNNNAIEISNSKHNNIDNNSFFSNGYCVEVDLTSVNNTISNNTAHNNYGFAWIHYLSHWAKVINNTALANKYRSLYISSSDNVTVTGNTMSSLGYATIYVISSDSCIIRDNRFWSTVVNQAVSDSSFYNSWDNGTHGNYYGDYTVRYPNATNDGVVWDTPYAIGGSSGEQDAKPLVWTPANTPPTIDAPGAANYTHATTGHRLNWTVLDAITGITWYWLYKDGALVKNGSWTPNMLITAGVDGLAMGTYNYTLIVSDGFSGTRNHTTMLTVINAAPVVSLSWWYVPSTFTASTSTSIPWQVTDASVGNTTYTTYRNGSVIATGSWESGETIYSPVYSLEAGVYLFTMVVDDGLGGSATGEIVVTVVPRQANPSDIILQWILGIMLAFVSILALVGLFKATKDWWHRKTVHARRMARDKKDKGIGS
jgi:parallel beta-helix repeat protein